MTEEEASPPAAAEPEGGRRAGVIDAQSALRLLLGLLTVWTLFSGLALVFFQGGADATIGGGLGGDEGSAAQRLLGVHLLVLAAIYGLIVWRPRQYDSLLWVPYAAQGGVVFVTFFDIITNERDFADGALPLIVAAIFLVLLVYVWYAGRQPAPVAPEVVDTGAAPETRAQALPESGVETPAGGAAESAPQPAEHEGPGEAGQS